MNNLRFWGYKHNSGSLHLKRFFADEDITEAELSPFVTEICYEITAPNTVEGRRLLEEYFNKPKNEQKTV